MKNKYGEKYVKEKMVSTKLEDLHSEVSEEMEFLERTLEI